MSAFFGHLLVARLHTIARASILSGHLRRHMHPSIRKVIATAAVAIASSSSVARGQSARMLPIVELRGGRLLHSSAFRRPNAQFQLEPAQTFGITIRGWEWGTRHRLGVRLIGDVAVGRGSGKINLIQLIPPYARRTGGRAPPPCRSPAQRARTMGGAGGRRLRAPDVATATHRLDGAFDHRLLGQPKGSSSARVTG